MDLSIRTSAAHQARETAYADYQPAAEMREWIDIPALVDGVASPDEGHVLASAFQIETVSRLHPHWLEPFQATLVCVAGIRRGEARRLLLAAVGRLDLSPTRRRQFEKMSGNASDLCAGATFAPAAGG